MHRVSPQEGPNCWCLWVSWMWVEWQSKLEGWIILPGISVLIMVVKLHGLTALPFCLNDRATWMYLLSWPPYRTLELSCLWSWYVNSLLLIKVCELMPHICIWKFLVMQLSIHVRRNSMILRFKWTEAVPLVWALGMTSVDRTLCTTFFARWKSCFKILYRPSYSICASKFVWISF